MVLLCGALRWGVKIKLREVNDLPRSHSLLGKSWDSHSGVWDPKWSSSFPCMRHLVLTEHTPELTFSVPRF